MPNPVTGIMAAQQAGRGWPMRHPRSVRASTVRACHAHTVCQRLTHFLANSCAVSAAKQMTVGPPACWKFGGHPSTSAGRFGDLHAAGRPSSTPRCCFPLDCGTHRIGPEPMTPAAAVIARKKKPQRKPTAKSSGGIAYARRAVGLQLVLDATEFRFARHPLDTVAGIDVALRRNWRVGDPGQHFVDGSRARRPDDHVGSATHAWQQARAILSDPLVHPATAPSPPPSSATIPHSASDNPPSAMIRRLKRGIDQRRRPAHQRHRALD
jgi:hypothetical protein